jgi:imidazolonepropionase-like amidohydrolase
MSNLKRLFDAGIPVGVGPDTGVPGAFPGIAAHREMQLMVQAGIPPDKVLVAATKTGAEYLNQPSLGTVEVGKVADVLIIDGDPLKDITNTYRVDSVIKAGYIIDRQKLLDQIMSVS